MSNASSQATYFTYRGLSAALNMVPRVATGPLATASGLAMSELWRSKRPLVRRNMRRALGPDASDALVDRTVTKAFESYARYWVESSRLAAMSERRFNEVWSIEGFDGCREAMDKGQGVILALPHLGNWEYGGRWLATVGAPMTTVAETLEPPELFKWFVAQRERLGLTILPPSAETSAILSRTLREGKLIGLVADRDLTGSGVEVDFFGETTTLPAGPATLAIRTGAVLFSCAVYDVGDGHYHGHINPPIDCRREGGLREDVTRITRALTRELEDLIRRAPEQWHMFQANWPADR
ncbi:MAG TPA: phosphatidylinositol mannoside acyltransferase [Acidimicrobiales bacterium]|nr:phosphatidylinositol mannoside acyltransferase [Acidimicrobiales bacterium]